MKEHFDDNVFSKTKLLEVCQKQRESAYYRLTFLNLKKYILNCSAQLLARALIQKRYDRGRSIENAPDTGDLLFLLGWNK